MKKYIFVFLTISLHYGCANENSKEKGTMTNTTNTSPIEVQLNYKTNDRLSALTINGKNIPLYSDGTTSLFSEGHPDQAKYTDEELINNFVLKPGENKIRLEVDATQDAFFSEVFMTFFVPGEKYPSLYISYDKLDKKTIEASLFIDEKNVPPLAIVEKKSNAATGSYALFAESGKKRTEIIKVVLNGEELAFSSQVEAVCPLPVKPGENKLEITYYLEPLLAKKFNITEEDFFVLLKKGDEQTEIIHKSSINGETTEKLTFIVKE